MTEEHHVTVSLAGEAWRRGLWPAQNQLQDATVTTDRQAAIAARAHQIWEAAGHPHGQDAQHWQQAEREHEEAEARAMAVEQFKATPVKATRKRAGKVMEAVGDVPAAPVQKARAPRKASIPAALN